MLLFSLNPVVAPLAAIAAGIVTLMLALFTREPNVPVQHDPEREIRRITRKVRHPWKARASRLLGID